MAFIGMHVRDESWPQGAPELEALGHPRSPLLLDLHVCGLGLTSSETQPSPRNEEGHHSGFTTSSITASSGSDLFWFLSSLLLSGVPYIWDLVIKQLEVDRRLPVTMETHKCHVDLPPCIRLCFVVAFPCGLA